MTVIAISVSTLFSSKRSVFACPHLKARPMKASDWLLILLLGTIWGSSFIFNAVLIRELGPLWVSAGRVSIGAAASWIFFAALRKPVPRDPRLYLQLGLLGVFAYAIPFALFPLSQQALASGVAAIVNAMTPIMTVIIGHFWLGGEKATLNKLIGVVAGVVGVTVLSLPAIQASGDSQLWAIGLCLLATLFYAVTLQITRRFSGIDPTTIVAIALTGASVAAVPTALILEGVPVVTSADTWLAWFGLGLLPTFVAFQVMYRILPRVGATNFSTTTLIAPISAIIMGALLLDEGVLPSHIAGMAFIFIGLLMIDGRLPRWLGTRRRARA